MKARGRTERRKKAFLRLKKRIDSKKVSKEFLAKISEFPNDKKEKAIEKYWERRNDEMSKLNAKGIK